jgi:hypothetical protein
LFIQLLAGAEVLARRCERRFDGGAADFAARLRGDLVGCASLSSSAVGTTATAAAATSCARKRRRRKRKEIVSDLLLHRTHLLVC